MRTCRPKSLHRFAQPATTSPSLARSGCALRRAANRRPGEQAALILNNLETVVADLAAGAIVVLGETTLRIHRLPIGEDSSP
jgi:hypothetical protein